MTITDAFTAPGITRPTPSPAAVALAIQCRRAKSLADTAPVRFEALPAAPAVSAAGGEVQFVVRPTCLADWARWTTALGIHNVRRMKSTGTATVVRFELDGVRGRLIGVGVPALLAQTYGPKGAAHHA
ncbi:hypothetical protein EES45_23190 [Streptomyces sp. ADI97-07]|uniref:hypothetical protein n=1 Tax=Streptomyces sp. ADI97-07 TaxID=1522762 RepID=UPI000F54D733|nr:hypothetical protein [Streptomyces sp. ADI97-07]RPK76400.1 hypothetical protein EES45_23190 [Streptomyces sp. ADI97-07]